MNRGILVGPASDMIDSGKLLHLPLIACQHSSCDSAGGRWSVGVHVGLNTVFVLGGFPRDVLECARAWRDAAGWMLRGSEHRGADATRNHSRRSVGHVCLGFSFEMSLKALIVLADKKPKYIHDVRRLYCDLPQNDRDALDELCDRNGRCREEILEIVHGVLCKPAWQRYALLEEPAKESWLAQGERVVRLLLPEEVTWLTRVADDLLAYVDEQISESEEMTAEDYDRLEELVRTQRAKEREAST